MLLPLLYLDFYFTSRGFYFRCSRCCWCSCQNCDYDNNNDDDAATATATAATATATTYYYYHYHYDYYYYYYDDHDDVITTKTGRQPPQCRAPANCNSSPSSGRTLA